MDNKTNSISNAEDTLLEEGIKRPVSRVEAIHILWDIAKKYEIALKHKKIVPIEEAEKDRQKINMLAQKLMNINERVIDVRVLYNLVRMQRFRDKKIILEFMTHRDVLKRIAYIVKRRGTPLVSIPGYTVKGISRLNKTQSIETDEKRNVSKGFEKEELTNIKKVIKNVEMIKVDEITTRDLDVLKKNITNKLFGKCIKIRDLANLFSPTELSLLSEMIRDNEIPSFMLDEETLCFKKVEENKKFNFITIAVAKAGELR